LLYQLGIGYNTPEGFAMAERVMGIIQDEAHHTSRKLADEKGVFPNWNKSVFAQRGVKMRNAALTTVAPTGTIAMMFDASGGVEPFFALAYHYKGILGGNVSLHYVNKYLERALKERGLYNETIINRIIDEGSLQQIPEIPADIKRVYTTAMDIKAEDHIRMQAAFQKHVDNSISKTCNFPHNATHEDVREGYLLGWRLGCKGMTVYRDGSRDLQVLNLNKDSKKEISAEPVAPAIPHAAPVAAPTPPAAPVFSRPRMEHAHAVVDSHSSTAVGQAAVREHVAVVLDPDTAHMSAKERIAAGLCPECTTKLQPAEGCTSCPNCGWALCAL
jgi:ribonucleoside-diphosphate reductase alpha chain